MTKDVLDQDIAIHEINVYRCDKIRVGVCLYVRNILTITVINVNIDRIERTEDLWLSVQKLPSIIIGCIYRHPHANSLTYDYILDIFNCMNLKNKSSYVLGDFHCNFLSKNNKMEQVIQSINHGGHTPGGALPRLPYGATTPTVTPRESPCRLPSYTE